MNIKPVLFVATLLAMQSLDAQTLFTYGSHAVSKKEFLQAFYKNPDTSGNKQEKLKQYLDLYINFRLKLQDAYDEKVNNDADLKAEADNFKAQLTENFINKQANIGQLLHEAFIRSQEDILLQQVFVPFSTGIDTVEAYSQITKAYKDLKAGKNFEDVASQYSTDSITKANNGNIGYITVFTLPYSIENIVYRLKPGEYSNIYKSSIGYHIFKNVSERPAFGRRKIEQLLFATPAFFSAEQINTEAGLADSVYNLLQTGTPFSSLLPLYGQNYYNYENANEIEVKVGDYAGKFENEVFSLKNKGDISKPFKTAFGYNIIKLDEILPVSSNENDVTFAAWLQTQIQNDGRLETARKSLAEKWLPLTGFKQVSYNVNDLWAYTDSALKSGDNLPALIKSVKPETALFQFTKKKILVKDWMDYLHFLEVPANINSSQDYEKHMHDFIRYACSNYYKEHIEDFDSDVAEQLKEFNDANMLFYVMDKHVWSKASNDTAGLKKYYEAHKTGYNWNQSVIALVISAPGKDLADTLAEKVKNNPSEWKNIISKYDNSVYADSNRFETGQLPVKQKVEFQKGFETIPESNEDGNLFTFVYVLGVYPQPQQKTFEEAKGLVINDYQQQLEKDWISNLKKIYPVKINTSVEDSLY